jgi:hypothetical protein
MRSILYLSTATSLALSQSTGLFTLFLPDSQPLSLEASVVTVNSAGTKPVTTVVVDCPTAASPDNDACRSADIYPAQVYHTQGSVWGGTTTYSADDSTTTWVCTLQGSPPDSGSAECTKTIVGGGSTRTETEEYGACYVGAHQRPIVITAGVDKIQDAHYATMDASELVSMGDSRRAEAGCPASETTMWAGTAASTTDAATGPSPTGDSADTTAPPTGTQPDSAPEETTTTSGAGRQGINMTAALLVGLVVTMMGVVL